jgi:uncharacterized protein DUF3313
MKRLRVTILAMAAVLFSAGAGMTAKAPATWDDLVKVTSKKLNLVYLLPGADFRGYTKVMIDPTEVAFKKNWTRDYNSTHRNLSQRVSEEDVRKVIDESTPVATEVFGKEYSDAGYPVVTTEGPDVLRIRTAVIDISVTAPDKMTAGRSRSYAGEAGQATLILEVRDSVTGAILGRAVDRRLAGDNGALLRNSVTNRGDFRLLVKQWAKISVNGLKELKALSPISQ